MCQRAIDGVGAMKNWIKWIGLGLFCLIFHQGGIAAQTDSTQLLVERIVIAYENFDYDQTDKLLSVALQNIGTFSRGEQVKVFQYMAFRQFQKNDRAEAEAYFQRILQLEPGFALDPVTTSPKILLLFQKVKISYLEGLQLRLGDLETSLFREERAWRSLVFPGWEQWHRGYKKKGTMWALLGTATLVGLGQSIAETRSRRDAYRAERDPALIPQKFDAYNRMFKTQFYWGYGLAAVWLGSHMDALLFSPVKRGTQVAVQPYLAAPGITLSLRL